MQLLNRLLFLQPAFLRLLIFVLAFAGFSVAFDLHAQVADAQKTADVQRLIDNDDAVAALKKQLGAKEISNVDYTKSLQELTKARNAILARYDRNGQRELVALYNATKRDLAIAARAAAAQKAQAAREAAAAEAKAKAEAAAQALAAEKQAVEDDARSYARLSILHDQLVVKESIQGANSADQQQMAEYRRQAGEITARYAKGAPMANHTNEFVVRYAQLSKELVAPNVKEAVASSLPSAESILAAYDTPEKQAAAFRFLDQIMRENVPAGSATLQQKAAEYLAAVNQIDPPNDSQHFKIADRAREIANDPEFRADLAKRFLGNWGVPYIQAAKAAEEAKRARAEWRVIERKTNLIFLAVFLVPFVYLLIGQRAKGAIASEKGGSFALPEALRVVRVFRKSYRLSCDSGIVYDKEVWTETTTTTTTTPGSVSSTGVVTHPTTTTHTSSTVYHRYWMRTPDGREVWRKFSDNVFLATVGQIISTLDFQTSVLVAHNHATNDLVPLRSGYNRANRLPGRWLWLACCIVGAGAFFLLQPPGGVQLYVNPNGYSWKQVVNGGITGIVIGSLIEVVILKIVVQMIRNRQFKRNYLPKLEEFLRQLTPRLNQHYSEMPVESPRIEKPELSKQVLEN